VKLETLLAEFHVKMKNRLNEKNHKEDSWQYLPFDYFLMKFKAKLKTLESKYAYYAYVPEEYGYIVDASLDLANYAMFLAQAITKEENKE